MRRGGGRLIRGGTSLAFHGGVTTVGMSRENAFVSEDRRENAVDALLDEIETSWRALWQDLEPLTDEELTGPTDAAGWRAQDHLAHLGAWERGVIFMLHGHPFRAGLGIDESLWVEGDIDAVNAAIFDLNRERALEDVRTGLRATHTELVAEVGTLDGERLDTRIAPGDSGDPSAPPTLREKIIGNTAEHYPEHAEWILALVKAGRE